MTIDKAIKMQEEIIDEGWLISDLEKCPAIDSCELAINIMRKYQKIEEIYNHQTGWALENSLREVIEDGKYD